MKNLLISGLVIGSLVACPIAFSDEAVQQTTETTVSTQTQEVVKPAVKKHHGKKHRKHRKHRCKKGCQHQSHKETPAEKKIDQETELTNR